VITLEVFGESEVARTVAERLLDLDGVSKVRIEAAARDHHSVVIASVSHQATDRVLDQLDALKVAHEDVSLLRVEEVGGAERGTDTSLIWADVVGLAGTNARLIGRYLALMSAAGVIACYGVIEASAILVVGAMAVSPDLLPIIATAVGVIGRSWRLAVRALGTLVIGMAVASGSGAVVAFTLNHLSLLPSTFAVGSSVLSGLTSISNETIVVALAAGVAGMLTFETRASSGVGVAISVTTIPAAAYLGVAAGVGQANKVLGAFGVLSMNVAMIVLGASVTLGLQRWRDQRRKRTAQG
jgi:uncharacterized hydrophobic protein (TIGR00271 family)